MYIITTARDLAYNAVAIPCRGLYRVTQDLGDNDQVGNMDTWEKLCRLVLSYNFFLKEWNFIGSETFGALNNGADGLKKLFGWTKWIDGTADVMKKTQGFYKVPSLGSMSDLLQSMCIMAAGYAELTYCVQKTFEVKFPLYNAISASTGSKIVQSLSNIGIVITKKMPLHEICMLGKYFFEICKIYGPTVAHNAVFLYEFTRQTMGLRDDQEEDENPIQRPMLFKGNFRDGVKLFTSSSKIVFILTTKFTPLHTILGVFVSTFSLYPAVAKDETLSRMRYFPNPSYPINI